MSLRFDRRKVKACLRDADGNEITRDIEIRTDPVTLRSSRITYSRAREKDRGQDSTAPLENGDLDTTHCPFCPENVTRMTPMLSQNLGLGKRLITNESILFPNLFPYTKWSAVALFDRQHYVEIGRASVASYRDCLVNVSRYLFHVLKTDNAVVFTSITQNFLPAAGGSLVHPHLQVHAEQYLPYFHMQLKNRADAYRERYGSSIYSDWIEKEKARKERYIGSTGKWEWAAAFAPEGFYEIWGVCPGVYSMAEFENEKMWTDLANGILNTQKFYRSMGRNSYNLGMTALVTADSRLELKVSLAARSNYAPWTRSDITGFEFTHREMATFTSPESTAENAGKYWYSPQKNGKFV